MTLEELFAQQLRAARVQSGYTQEQVAEAVSVTVRWYQRLEKKEIGKLPGKMTLLRLTLFLHLDLEPLRDKLGLLTPSPCPRGPRKVCKPKTEAAKKEEA